MPEILKSIFGAEDLIALCWQTVVVSAVGIPACAFAIWCLPRMGGRSLLVWGFVSNAVAFFVLQVAYAVYPDDPAPAPPNNPNLKFSIFCWAIFTLNWGTNLATYIVPVAAFPSGVRGTFHGLSAAAGKAGAALGAFLYPVVVSALGGTRGAIAVFALQVVINGLGAFVSWRYLPDDTAPVADDDEDEHDEVYSGLLSK